MLTKEDMDEGMMTHRAIAKELGITDSSVNATLQRAIRKLRKNPRALELLKQFDQYGVRK